MGAGASSRDLTDDEKAKYAELEALSPEAQEALAMAAMKDVLLIASKFAVAEGQKEEIWKEDKELAIPPPMAGFFDHVAQTVAKVPLVGSGLARPITGLVSDVKAALASCAVAICQDPRTLARFTAAADGLSTSKAKQCGEKGGTAYVDFLFETAGGNLAVAMTEVSATVLEAHKLTKIWGSAIDACNAAAKALKMEPLELDLPSYAASQTLASLGMLVARKEASVRGGVVEGTTDNVVKVFGGCVTRTADELVKALVLVKKGDPCSLALSPAAAEGLKGTNTSGLKRDTAALAGAPCLAATCSPLAAASASAAPASEAAQLSFVSKFGAVQKQVLWQHIEVGVGVPSPEQRAALAAACADRVTFAGTTLGLVTREAAAGEGTTSGGSAAAEEEEEGAAAAVDLMGAPVALVRRDNFLYLCIAGDAYPLAVYKWRYFAGNKVVACRHMELNSVTWRTHGGCDWVIDEVAGTVSPAKAPGLVLGLRLVDGPVPS